jgi:aminopeptidase
MRSHWLDRLADVLVNYSCSVKPGDLVSISSNPLALPLVAATFEAVVKAGGHPFWRAAHDDLAEILLEHGSDEQLEYVSPLDLHMVETIDVQIGFWAETNTRAMSRIDPARSALRQSARRPYMSKFLERVADKSLRWVGTLYPTEASAQDAEMSLRQY